MTAPCRADEIRGEESHYPDSLPMTSPSVYWDEFFESMPPFRMNYLIEERRVVGGMLSRPFTSTATARELAARS